jgi:adenosine kinase
VTGLITGAEFLLTNDYEKSLLESTTGLTDEQILDLVKVWVTTLGKNGVQITGRGFDPIHVPAVADVVAADPTGVGDGFRSGFFAALSWGLGFERAAQVGSMVAAMVLETVGTQEYAIHGDDFAKRFADAYGEAAAAEVQPHLPA